MVGELCNDCQYHATTNTLKSLIFQRPCLLPILLVSANKYRKKNGKFTGNLNFFNKKHIYWWSHRSVKIELQLVFIVAVRVQPTLCSGAVDGAAADTTRQRRLVEAQFDVERHSELGARHQQCRAYRRT